MPLTISENGFDYSVVIADTNHPFRLADIPAYVTAQGQFHFKEVEAGWVFSGSSVRYLSLMEMKAWFDDNNPKYREVILTENNPDPKYILANYATNELAKKIIDVVTMLTSQLPHNLAIAASIHNEVIGHIGQSEPLVALFIIKARPNFIFGPLKSAIQEQIELFLQANQPALVSNLTVLVMSKDDFQNNYSSFDVQLT